MIKFQSKGAAPFEMRQEHAMPLLALMGQSKNEEGSISGEALAAALDNLKAGLARQAEESEPEVEEEDDWEDEPKDEPISLATRAAPLKDMLNHAINNETYLMWQPA